MHRILVLVLLTLRAPAADPEPLKRLGSDRFRQAERVEAIAYSPDGKRLATADKETIYLWDAADGRLLRTIAGLESRKFVALHFNADGTAVFAVAITEKKDAIFYHLDPANGETVAASDLMGAGRENYSEPAVRFSPDGAWVAARRGDGREFAVVETATGKRAWSDASGDKPFAAFAFSPDGKGLALSRWERPIRLHDLPTGKVLREYRVEGGVFSNLAFSPDGKALIAESANPWPNHVVRFDAETGRVRWTFQADRAKDLLFTPDGKSIVYFGRLRGANPDMWHWLDAATGRPRHVRMDTGPGYAVAVRPDGQALAIGGYHGHIAQWDLTARTRLLDASADPPGPVTGLRFAPDGSKLIGQCGYDFEWDVKTGRQTRVASGQDAGVSERTALSPDRRWVVRAQLPGRARVETFALVEVATGRRHVFPKTTSNERAEFLADGRLLIHRPDQLSVYEPDARTRVLQLGTNGRPGAVAASADGTTAVRVTKAGEHLRLTRWDLKSGEPVGECVVRPSDQVAVTAAWDARLSPDGRVAAMIIPNLPLSGGRIQILTALFDARTGRYRSAWREPGRQPGLAFSPDGRAVVCFHPSGGGVIVREACTGRERVRRPGLSADDAVFSPDGRTLALSTPPGPVALWDLIGRAGRGQDIKPAELWTALESEDAEFAYTAIRYLHQHPAEAVAFLNERMKVPTGPTVDWVAGRIKALDAAQFQDREKATADLAALGDEVHPALRAALPKASAEARRRLEGLLEQAGKRTPESWRAVRACEALEGIGTREARDLLVSWAKGPPATTLTREATESLERLARRGK